MNTAQIKKHKIIITTGFIAISTVFLSLNPGAFAQSVSNPFIPNTVTSDESQPIPELISETADSPQKEIALTAIPPRLGDDGSLKAAPGEKLQIQLRVRNISEQPISVITSAQDFVLDSDGETPVPIDDATSNRWSLASWLTITPTEHTIGSKSTAGINVLVEIPEDALPGGHYAMVLHEPGNRASTGGSNTAINQRVGTLLYVIVDGPINEEAYVRDFSFPKFSEYGPVPFGFTVENNSDVHITPQMSVEVYDILGRKVETIGIEPKNIFPLTSRDFTGQWDRVWGWGLYKAKLTMSYGSAGAIVVTNTSFWLLPIKVIIAVMTILLGLLLAGLAVKRHLKHKKSIEEKRIAELEEQIEKMQSNE
ncbi:MAG: hypothetical protein BroJett025_00030 [Patescibacteria group bacterium]|nr:MAG: hypothetical protein BroJett025_00030 [Patescibacteria group bacterium]